MRNLSVDVHVLMQIPNLRPTSQVKLYLSEPGNPEVVLEMS